MTRGGDRTAAVHPDAPCGQAQIYAATSSKPIWVSTLGQDKAAGRSKQDGHTL